MAFHPISPHLIRTSEAGLLPKTSAPSSPQLQPAGAAAVPAPAAVPAVPAAAVPAASGAAAPAAPALDGLKAPAKSGEEEDEAGCSQS